MQYKLITHNAYFTNSLFSAFEISITKLLEDGWELHGETLRMDSTTVAQAVVKYHDIKIN